MKKFLKIMGGGLSLALLAALLFTGCQKEPAWEEDVTETTTTVELSNGTWEYSNSISYEGDYKDLFLGDMEEDELAELPEAYKTLTGKMSSTYKDVYTIKIADDAATVKDGKVVSIIKFPDAADKTVLENTVASEKAKGNDVTLKGTTVTITEKISAENIAKIKVTKAAIIDQFAGTEIKTNKKHTKYMLTASIEQNGTKISSKRTLSKK